MILSFTTDLLIASLLLSLAVVAYRKRHRFSFPPGPRGWPIIGNLLDVPRHNPWIAYVRMSHKLGSDIIYMNVLNTPIIVLNSKKSIEALLDKRSNIYSDRPTTTMTNMTGLDKLIFQMQYGDEWRAYRRTFHQHFNEQAVSQYEAQVSKYTAMFLKLLLDAPEGFLDHSRWFAGALILNVVYGFDIRDNEDPHLVGPEKAIVAGSAVLDAGAFLVDTFPVLRHIPSWFPGAWFKRQAAGWRKDVLGMIDDPWRTVQQEMHDGKASSSIASALIAKLDDAQDKDRYNNMIQRVSGTAFGGGQDTSMRAMHTFILTMLQHPEVQKAGQEELDRAVGADRLPEYADQDALPLVTAIVWEFMRWRPIVPFGVPHRVITDDIYDGYHIPAGALVIGNAWSILHDPAIYPNPDQFNPHRFLTAAGKLDPAVPPPDAGFGFGRRVCPGRYFSMRSIWTACAQVLATFDIRRHPAEDGDGEVEFGQGLIVGPKPFKADIRPRSVAAAELVRSAHQ